MLLCHQGKHRFGANVQATFPNEIDSFLIGTEIAGHNRYELVAIAILLSDFIANLHHGCFTPF
jgi:hypothetical protein